MWTKYLEVACRIFIATSSIAIKKSKNSADVLITLTNDIDAISKFFQPYLTDTSIQNKMQIIQNMRQLLESSVELLGICCTALRKAYPDLFDINIIKAALQTRSDLSSDEKKEALKLCGNILANLTTEAPHSKALNQPTEIIEEHPLSVNASSPSPSKDFDIDSFIKNGGVNEKPSLDKSPLKEEQRAQNLSGNLMKARQTGFTITGFKYQKRYFSVKGESLYWYRSKLSKEAMNSIPLSSISSIMPDKTRNFIILGDKKVLKLKAENTEMRDMWIDKLQIVVKEYTSGKTPIVQNVYEKKSILSIFKDYDVILKEKEIKLRPMVKEVVI